VQAGAQARQQAKQLITEEAVEQAQVAEQAAEEAAAQVNGLVVQACLLMRQQLFKQPSKHVCTNICIVQAAAQVVQHSL
jgi:hypothetical protein